MFPFRKREPKPTPPWLTWGVLAFIAFAFASQLLAPKQQGPQPDWNLFDIDAMRATINPAAYQIMSKDIKPGSGAPAMCGQQVTLRYRVLEAPKTPADKPVQAGPATELSFRVGAEPAPAGLMQAALGMKAGGARQAVVPAELTALRTEATQAAPSNIGYDIEMIAITPSIPAHGATDLSLRIQDLRVGQKQLVSCGDTVKLHLTLWAASGKQLFSTRDTTDGPLSVTLGAGLLPLGLEDGLTGMRVGGARLLVIPPALTVLAVQNNDGALPLPPLPPGQLIVAEAELIP